MDDKHKRSKSQSSNGIKIKKISKSQDQSFLLNKKIVKNPSYGNNQSTENSTKRWNFMNEYLENPHKHWDGKIESGLLYHNNSGGKHFDYYLKSNKRSGSKGKREKLINYPAKSIIKPPNMVTSKKRIGGSNIPNTKKTNFKSFDLRRAITKLDQREWSLEEPKNCLYTNPLRSSSACHKKNLSNERRSNKHKPYKSGKIYLEMV